MRILISILSFLLLTDESLSESKRVPNNAVLDMYGNKLLPNANYTILPASLEAAGLATYRRNSTCPFIVAVAKSWQQVYPLILLPTNSCDEAIRVSTDMNIMFSSTGTTCERSMIWRISELDSATGRWYVTVGSLAGSPGPSTWRNWFKIERYGLDYKLVFCPSVCTNCKGILCGDVGVFEEDGCRWLGLSDVPFPVMFEKFY